MSQAARRYEILEIEEIEVPFVWRRSLPDGAKVSVHYSVDNGIWDTCELRKTDHGYEGAVNMPEGARFQYKFIIEKSSGEIEWYPKGGPETNLNGIAEKAVSSSPSPQVPENQARLKSSVKKILEATKSHDGAIGLNMLFDSLEEEFDEMGMTGDQRKLLFEVTAQAIREMKGIPEAVRNFFRKELPAPKTYNELEELLRKGSKAFKKKVFQNLFSNKEARDFFGLKDQYDPLNPLGSPEHNQLFGTICAEFGDLGEIAPYLGAAIETAGNIAARNPEATKKRMELMKKVMARMEREEPGLLQEIPLERKAWWTDVAFQAAVVAGGVMTGTVVAPAALLVAKPVLGKFFGVKTSNILEWKRNPNRRRAWEELRKTAWENNLVRQALTTQGRVVDVLKRAITDSLKRAIPGSSIFMDSSGAEGGEGGGAIEKGDQAQALIRRACKANV